MGNGNAKRHDAGKVMRTFELPAPEDELIKLASKYQTPFHVYDKSGIEGICKDFKNGFSWCETKGTMFKNFFAVKATPNPVLMKMLADQGMGFDCSSIGELKMCKRLGYTGEDIMFTSNNTDFEEYREAARMGAIINLDDYSQIECLVKALKADNQPIPKLLCFRYNPGPARTGNVLIGEPVEAKYGLTKNQLMEGYKKLQELGVERFGLHTMVVSNSLDIEELAATVEEVFKLTVELHEKLEIKLDFCNFGGGIGVAYKPDQCPVSFKALGDHAEKLWEKYLVPAGLKPKMYYECGRVITCDNGWIVSRVKNMKNTYKNYVGVDATMADLMRPGMYGAYHHVSMVKDPGFDRSNLPDFNTLKDASYADPGYSGKKSDKMYDVTGSLCENNDKFAIDRHLDVEPSIGDICVIHNTGAHGHSMGFNYNAKMRHGEVLRVEANKYQVIRRAEVLDDYLTTVKDQFQMLETGEAIPTDMLI